METEVGWSRSGQKKKKKKTMTRLKAAGKHCCFGVLEAPHTSRGSPPVLQHYPSHNSDMPAPAKEKLKSFLIRV